MSRPAKHFYEFGRFRLDPEEHLLLRNGKPVALTPKVFDILLVLIRNSGHVVEKGELMRAVWPDSFVEENNLTVNMSALRKALGTGHAERQYIETVPKRGYRFFANVREVRGESPDLVEEYAGARLITEEKSSVRRDQAITSLAVLPLVNASADPQMEYLSDGITETIINSLAQLPQLRVMARSTVFRYKGREADPQAVGHELGVGAVLTGRVSQVGESLIISMELVDVAHGWQLWGEQYNRNPADIFALQEEIAREISGKLRLRLTGEQQQRLTKRYTESTEAYQAYLRGRYHWNKYTREGLKKGTAYFQQAIDLDPGYALAYAGLADSYYRLSNLYLPPREAMPKAKAAAMKALEIEEMLAEAHASLGLVRFWYEWDWQGAEREYKRAIELNPGYAIAPLWYGLQLMALGRFDDALAEMKRAQDLDPLSLVINTNLGGTLYRARRYDQAIEQCRRTLEIDSSF